VRLIEAFCRSGSFRKLSFFLRLFFHYTVDTTLFKARHKTTVAGNAGGWRPVSQLPAFNEARLPDKWTRQSNIIYPLLSNDSLGNFVASVSPPLT
jgi:hypothetical protein